MGSIKEGESESALIESIRELHELFSKSGVYFFLMMIALGILIFVTSLFVYVLLGEAEQIESKVSIAYAGFLSGIILSFLIITFMEGIYLKLKERKKHE